MEWTFVWMMVVLKIPVVAAIWLVWWAMKAEPELTDDDGGIDVPDAPPPHRPPHPRRPRRGPHGDPEAPSPPRVRTTKAASRIRTDA